MATIESLPLAQAIEALSVRPVEVADADGKVDFGFFHQQMIMIGPSNNGVANPTATTDPKSIQLAGFYRRV